MRTGDWRRNLRHPEFIQHLIEPLPHDLWRADVYELVDGEYIITNKGDCCYSGKYLYAGTEEIHKPEGIA